MQLVYRTLTNNPSPPPHAFAWPHTALSDALVALTNLRSLDFPTRVYPPGPLLPDGISRLSKLTHLGLTASTLPQYIYDMTSLRSLECRRLPPHGHFALPQEIANLSQLSRLVVYSTGLSSLPEDFGVGLGDSLVELDLSGNRNLLHLPASFAAMSRLTSLNLAGQASLVGDPNPDTIGSMGWICAHLPRLRRLDVYGCKLQEVCASVCECGCVGRCMRGRI